MDQRLVVQSLQIVTVEQGGVPVIVVDCNNSTATIQEVTRIINFLRAGSDEVQCVIDSESWRRDFEAIHEFIIKIQLPGEALSCVYGKLEKSDNFVVTFRRLVAGKKSRAA